jgi:hypothetical protein
MAFAEYLLQDGRARYDAVFNDSFRGDAEVEGFMQRFGLSRRCATLEELADFVDVGFVQSCNWDNHLAEARPFIERGKPVFVDKPLAGKLADLRAFEALAAEGAVILGSSSVRYAEEIAEFLARPEEERGEVVSVFGTAGVDEFNYGVHVVEALGGLLGTGAESAEYVGSGRRGGQVCETFFVRYASGVTGVYNTFTSTWQPFEMVIMTTKSTYQFRLDTGKIYGALLDRLLESLTGARTVATVPELSESVQIMLAGRLSREAGGGEVRLEAIPAEDPGYDGGEFARGYAAASGKYYAV